MRDARYPRFCTRAVFCLFVTLSTSTGGLSMLSNRGGRGKKKREKVLLITESKEEARFQAQKLLIAVATIFSKRIYEKLLGTLCFSFFLFYLREQEKEYIGNELLVLKEQW
eukprot:TRINITY_DN2105_c2_g2_i1.p1 TRINITY_DN2105_c2_g2~~TRINITY_DN2105_c2_g2_i1.p1  ORF type:complete len:111 (+),score=0.13 TRINITY_DN2105_c2_g2_i1:117-449(+)